MTMQSFKDTSVGAIVDHNGHALEKVEVRDRTKGTGGRINAVDIHTGDEFWIEPFIAVMPLELKNFDRPELVDDELTEAFNEFDGEEE